MERRRSPSNPYPDANEWIIDQFIAGEPERRLGQFDSASARFLSLTDRKEVREEVFERVLKVRLYLVGSRDTRKCASREPPPDAPAKAAVESPWLTCRPLDDLPEVLPGQPCEAPLSKSAEAAILYAQEMAGEDRGRLAEGTILYRKALAMENSCKARDAMQFYGLTANAGHGKAAKRLGDIYASGVPGVVRDHAFSLRWYERARQPGEKVPPR